MSEWIVVARAFILLSQGKEICEQRVKFLPALFLRFLLVVYFYDRLMIQIKSTRERATGNKNLEDETFWKDIITKVTQ